ncbi:MAG: ABC transporter permease [Cyclobacteriaceae bacterium]
MLNHYLKITLRSIQKHSTFFLLNLLGLTVGLMCAIIIFLYVTDELGYEATHSKAENIKRLTVEYFLPNDGGSENMAAIGPAVAPLIKKDFPEVENYVRFNAISDELIKKPISNEEFFQTITYVDSTLFDVFDYNLVKGNPETALDNPNSLIITQDLAKNLFGSLDVIGKTLELPNDSLELSITGVFDELPRQSHIHFEAVSPLSTRDIQDTWWWFDFHTYLLMNPKADVEAFGEKIVRFSKEYIADQEKMSGYYQEFYLQNLEDIHLHSDLRGEMSANSKMENVVMFGIIGAFILIIACINFMNLSTAKGITRAKEIGIRKVTGALKGQLIFQFLMEALIISIMALALAVAIMALSLDSINYLLNKNFLMNDVFEPTVLLSFLGISVFTGLLSGSYPALVLSSYKPSQTLRGTFKNTSKGQVLRKTLVVFQFSISIILIIGTIVVFQQMDYLKNLDLGFNKNRIITIPSNENHTSEATKRKFQVLKDDISSLSSVDMTALSASVPGREMNNAVVRIGWDESAEWTDMRYLLVDEEFTSLYDLEISAGRNFEKTRQEEGSFLINESALDRFGFASPEEAIGQKLRWWDVRGEVIGVLKDFHYMSPADEVQPFIMIKDDRQIGYLTASFSSSNFQQTLGEIEQIWNEVYPSRSFDYNFLDEDFDRQYKSEERFQELFSTFAVIAIVIACLGLFGLSLFSIQLRTKEIGIRKALGASFANISLILSSSFFKPIFIAALVAFPITWFTMDWWLTDFANRINISLDVFIYGIVLTMLVALLTISYNSIKAATTNPVKALKDE